jgi:hypothetical protein
MGDGALKGEAGRELMESVDLLTFARFHRDADPMTVSVPRYTRDKLCT